MSEIQRPLLTCGVDEAGRGPIAGPVIAAAVILDPKNPITGITDSKKLSEKKRNALNLEIREKALCWSIAHCSVEEIDELNILHATMLAMKRAVESLHQRPELVLIDGNRLPKLAVPAEAIIGGDLKEACIGAASILAKVERDSTNARVARTLPTLQFLPNTKAYGTAEHLAALKEHGVSPIHRKSFRPVRDLL